MAGLKIAIQLPYSRVFLDSDTLVQVSDAHEWVGSVGDEGNITPRFKFWSNHWYTHFIPATSMQLIEIKHNAEFMHGLGIADFQARLPAIPQINSQHKGKIAVMIDLQSPQQKLFGIINANKEKWNTSK